MTDMPNESAAARANAALRQAEWAESKGLLDQAVDEYRKVISLFPNLFEVHNNLANLLLALDRPQEALAAARSAHALQPADALVNANLGQALLRCNQPVQAVPYLTAALAGQPHLYPLRRMLADTLLELGRSDEAVALFNQIDPRLQEDLELLNTMAHFYHRARIGRPAELCFLRMIQIAPTRASAYNDLAHLYLDFSQFTRAKEFTLRGLAVEPEAAVLWNTLAKAQMSIGLIDQSIASYRKVLELAPNLAPAHSNLLLVMHYSSEISPEELAEEHRRWGRRYAPPALATQEFANTPDPERRIRIGYLSPDFRRHSVSFFIEPVFEHHDRAHFEVFGYGDVKTPDEVTQRLKGRVDHYRSVEGLMDAQIVDVIRRDGIDILVDLAGHAGNVHAAVLGHKPAPVLVTYCGYPNSTGIEAVDYRITDGLADPPGAERYYTEELLRLPGCFLCYRPPAEAPEPGPPPMLTRGHVTFGSFNREFKVSQRTYDLWSRIVRAVPGSRIVMKSIAGHDPETHAFQLGEFERRGVDPARVQLIGFIDDPRGHLGAYLDVDIALDTFPYNGTTTTLDSLLMGVPVVTLAGDHHASRVGVSLLTNIGLPELIAHSDDEYVALAIALATDPQRVLELHRTLRERLLASPLCDGPTFTAKFEAALRAMWQRWCRAQQPL